MSKIFFVETTIDHVSFNDRAYPKGSVVETDKYRRDELVNRGHAVDHPGPAREAEWAEDDLSARLDALKQARGRRPEKAATV